MLVKDWKHEPLVEIFQHKGSSECSHMVDEECLFEYVPFNNLIADRYNGWLTQKPTEQDFVRWALKEDLFLNTTPNSILIDMDLW